MATKAAKTSIKSDDKTQAASKPAVKSEDKIQVEGLEQKGLVEKVVNISRTTKVVKGGRILRFGALVVVGNQNGGFGIGLGKAREVQLAIQKAIDAARKNMIFIRLNSNFSIQHPCVARHGSTKVIMQPAGEGTGIIAGGAMRAIFEVAGVQNILSKCVGSTNPVNVVRATLNGLKHISTPESIAEKRGKTVEEIIG